MSGGTRCSSVVCPRGHRTLWEQAALQQHKQTSPLGCALRISSFTAIIPWLPVDNYYIKTVGQSVVCPNKDAQYNCIVQLSPDSFSLFGWESLASETNIPHAHCMTCIKAYSIKANYWTTFVTHVCCCTGTSPEL